MHSDYSSGAKPIREIARIAEAQNIDAVILSDHLHERYEYGIRPLHGILKKTYQRESILKKGAEKYLEEIKKTNLSSDVIVIDGASVTPFYFWSGDLFKGALTMHNRAKDLLVLGAGRAEEYERIPTTSRNNSGFTQYGGEKYEKPYQKVIDFSRERKTLVVWSHPAAEEHYQFKNIAGLRVALESSSYENDVLRTQNYDALGIFSTELTAVASLEAVTNASVGGLWDQVLLQYIRGARQLPVWAIGEVDFNGYPQGIRDLDSILNRVIATAKKRENILDAIKVGKNYLVMSPSRKTRPMLEEFSVKDALGISASMGEVLKPQSGSLEITVSLSGVQSDTAVMLVRNGRLIASETRPGPFRITFADSVELSSANRSNYYYRLIITSSDGTRVLSNPIFIRP